MENWPIERTDQRTRRLWRRPGLLVPAVVFVAVACTGAERQVDDVDWLRPEAVIAIPPDDVAHPLSPVVDALDRQDCSDVVEETTRLRLVVESEVAAAAEELGDGAPEASEGITAEEWVDSSPQAVGHAVAMRHILNDYVYRQPPVLVVGEHGFVYPNWWTDAYGYCLGELGRYNEAADVYTAALQNGMDLEVAWRLALVLAWDGRNREAIEVLEAWPAGAPRPAAYDSVLSRLR